MAEGRDPGNYLSPLEEQYLHESEPNDDDFELQLHGEKEPASQKLWQTFQESATAVAHLIRGKSTLVLFSLSLSLSLSLSPSFSLSLFLFLSLSFFLSLSPLSLSL